MLKLNKAKKEEKAEEQMCQNPNLIWQGIRKQGLKLSEPEKM